MQRSKRMTRRERRHYNAELTLERRKAMSREEFIDWDAAFEAEDRGISIEEAKQSILGLEAKGYLHIFRDEDGAWNMRVDYERLGVAVAKPIRGSLLRPLAHTRCEEGSAQVA